MSDQSLYQRLGGYDGLTAFANNALPRLLKDTQLARFWQNRGDDGVAREKQLLIDFLANVTGGPMYYTGRDMIKTHKGMGITDSDWEIFMGHAAAAMTEIEIPENEFNEVAAFVTSLKNEIVD